MKEVLFFILPILLFSGCSIKASENKNDNNVMENPIYVFISKNNDLDIVYTLIADIDGDLKTEYFVATGENNPILWQIDNNGIGSIIVNAENTQYLETELVDRGKEKHIAFMAQYPPSNTQLWVLRIDNGTAKTIFDFMADWEVRIVQNGFNTVWKKYKDEGGYDLIGDYYIWNDQTMKYELN